MNVLKRFKAKRYVIAGIVALSVTVLAAVVITTMEPTPMKITGM